MWQQSMQMWQQRVCKCDSTEHANVTTKSMQMWQQRVCKCDNKECVNVTTKSLQMWQEQYVNVMWKVCKCDKSSM